MGVVEAAVIPVFWGCLGLVAYIYIGYPLTLLFLSEASLRRVSPALPPRVTVVIAAFNEVRHIVATVQNKLSQRYPGVAFDLRPPLGLHPLMIDVVLDRLGD